MKEVTHYGRIEKGKLKLDNREFFEYDLQSLEGLTVEITVKAKKITRSLRMNRYLWGIVYPPAVIEFNNQNTFDKIMNKDKVHSYFKGLFIGYEELVHPHEGATSIEESTTELNNQEFITYFESIIAWCAEWLNIQIPYPNEELAESIDYKMKS